MPIQDKSSYATVNGAEVNEEIEQIETAIRESSRYYTVRELQLKLSTLKWNLYILSSVSAFLLLMLYFILSKTGNESITTSLELHSPTTESWKGIDDESAQNIESTLRRLNNARLKIIDGDIIPEAFARARSFTNDRINQFMIIPKYKLLACAIPKVGCSSLLSFGKYLTDCDEDIYSCNKPGHANWVDSKEKLMNVLQNPSWTKMVFLREPKERLLSGFLNKCDRTCCSHCPHYETKKKAPEFEEFLRQVRLEGLKGDNGKNNLGNAHFVPQSLQCGGLENTIGYYDFVGILSNGQTVYEQMLEVINLDARFDNEEFRHGIELFYNRDFENDTYSNPQSVLKLLKNEEKVEKKAHKRTDQLMAEYYDKTRSMVVDGLYADDKRLMKSMLWHPNATNQFRRWIRQESDL